MADLSFKLIDGTLPSAIHVLDWNNTHCCNCKHGGDDGLQCPIFRAGYDSWITKKVPDAIQAGECLKFKTQIGNIK